MWFSLSSVSKTEKNCFILVFSLPPPTPALLRNDLLPSQGSYISEASSNITITRSHVTPIYLINRISPERPRPPTAPSSALLVLLCPCCFYGLGVFFKRNCRLTTLETYLLDLKTGVSQLARYAFPHLLYCWFKRRSSVVPVKGFSLFGKAVTFSFSPVSVSVFVCLFIIKQVMILLVQHGIPCTLSISENKQPYCHFSPSCHIF